MQSQKAFVVETVKQVLGTTFTPYVDKALLKLSNAQLEEVKRLTAVAIMNSTVEYSKSRTELSEVNTYARSMVMNHLKKAKELNGNLVFASNGTKTVATKVAKEETPKGIDLSLLPADLKEYVSKLV